MATRGPPSPDVHDHDGGTTILAHGMSTLSEDAARLTRPGLGHPEGFLEAFANFYRDLADELRARRDGTPHDRPRSVLPDRRDGLIGVQFVEAGRARTPTAGTGSFPPSHSKAVV